MANNCNSCANCNGGAYHRNRGYRRNTYAALNTLPRCNSCMNYPYYTGRCPDECGCYNCGCHAGVSSQNTRAAFYNNCGACEENCCCDNNARGNTCGCHTGCNDGCNGCYGSWNIPRENCGYCNACNTVNGGCGNGCNAGCVCGCCCDGGDDPVCDCPAPVYGMFTSAAPLTVAASGSVPFAMGVNTGDFAVNGGNITLQQAGNYLATITLQLPGDTAADATLNLNLNGSALPAARIDIDPTTADGNVASHASQAIFTASEGSVISLAGDSAFTIPGVSGQNLITLTLIRLGD